LPDARIDRQLSIVVPAFDEERRIGTSLAKLLGFGKDRLAGFEVIVVDDGSRDRTAALVDDIARAEPHLRLVRLPKNQGKGAAVRRGMLEARLGHALFTDADLSTPIEDVELLFAALGEAQVAIGSRALAGSRIELRQPFYREWMGRGFNLIVQGAALPGIHDSQCGFKLFEIAAARELFTLARLDGFAFDVEILYLCRKLGIRVAEVPVRWRNDAASKVKPIRDALRMARDLALIRVIHR
jgi:dolichyl-phosphate beta-glucosyltransferase